MTDEKKTYQLKLSVAPIEHFHTHYGDKMILWGMVDAFLTKLMELDKEAEGKGFDSMIARITQQVKQETEV